MESIKSVPRDKIHKKLTFKDLDIGEYFIFRYDVDQWCYDVCMKKNCIYAPGSNNFSYVKSNDRNDRNNWLTDDTEVARVGNMELHYDILN